MKHTTLTAALVVLTTLSAFAGIKEIGTVNGVRLVRVKTAGLFAPSSTMIVGYVPGQTNTLEVLSSTGSAGIVPSVATAGGVVAGAALLRPARTHVKTEASPSTSVSTGGGTTTINAGHVHNHTH